MYLSNAKYLDPKNDLTFRKIFGHNPGIMKSFLNSMLPFEEGQYIESLVYQDPAMLPVLPELKHSIVDVKCTDNFGRQFIVEMQMYWTSSFKQRMLFNAGKAYVKQLEKGFKYDKLYPVYGLSLVNDIFLKEEVFKEKFYHHYKLSHQEIPNEEIEGIELIFIELPKFTPQTFTHKKVQNLWLRFLTEIDEHTTEVPNDFYSENEIKEALEHLQISAFSKSELEYYEKYWDKIRVERTAIDEANERTEKALQEKEKAQKEKEQALLREKNLAKKMAKMMLQLGKSITEITKETGLSENEIKKL